MNYEINAISEQDWPAIRERSDILRATKTLPANRAVNIASGNFLVEIGNDDSRGELFRRCVFVTSVRSTLVTLSDAEAGKYQTSWKAWDGIQESEIASLNNELIDAVVALYGFRSDLLIQKVTHNPYLTIPTDTLLYTFDTNINLWFSSERNKIMNRYADELTKGKKSFFKWRFYWARWRGMPTYTKIDESLIQYLSPYFWNPSHLATLLAHLDEGGSRYCEDTKRVLTHLRNNERKPFISPDAAR